MTDYERNADVSKTLTDKWKKGELANGTYYVRLNHDSSTIDVYDCGVWWSDTWHEITEVLAKVPSYEEWQRIFHYASKYEFEYTSCAMDYENLKQENTKLKELLKECKYELRGCYTDIGWEDQSLINKIDQALGE